MSIYVMTVGDLAKKRGEPVGEFVKKIQELGFDAGSHAKKLTQKDLDNLIYLLGTNQSKPEIPVPPPEPQPEPVQMKVHNPNVLMINLPSGRINVVYADAHIEDSGKIKLSVIEQSTEPTIGEALLEFRKQMGLKMGVN